MIFDCRLHENRVDLAKKYLIKPLIYSCVLRNQQKLGCCDNNYLSGKYFGFEYQNKINPSDNGIFFVGEYCGFDFIEILKLYTPDIKTPIFFDPYHKIQQKLNQQQISNTLSTDTFFKMTSLNKEVYLIINLLCIAWNQMPYGSLSAIMNFCMTSKVDTQDWTINVLNKIISYDKMNRKFIDIYKELQDKYEVRNDFKFNLCSEIINKNGWLNNLEYIL